jgi:CDGSH-type Zn-finger protein
VSRPRIRLDPNGTYIVSGAVPLHWLARGEDGAWREGAEIEAGDPYALCRCGNSSTKPFADESACSEDRATPANVLVPRPVSWDMPASSPMIAIKPDGPLRVRGVELSGPDGRAFEPAERYSLCRCGRSNTMPFCDGTHKEVGFRG